MKAYQIQTDGGIDAIERIEMAEPQPGPGRFWCECALPA